MSQLSWAEQQAEERWLTRRGGLCSLCNVQCRNSLSAISDHIMSPLHFARLVHQPFVHTLREYRYCGLCSSQNVQRASVRPHIEGRGHQQRLGRLDDQEIGRLDRLNSFLEQRDALDAIARRDDPPGQTSCCVVTGWFDGGEICRLCKARCRAGSIDSHLNGRKHFFTWREWLKGYYERSTWLTNRDELLQEIGDQEKPLPDIPPHADHPSPDRAGQPRMRIGQASPSPTLSLLSPSLPPPSPARPAVVASNSQPPHQSVIVGDLCNLCNVRIGRPGAGDPTPAIINTHVLGVRHRMRVQLIDSKWQGEQSIKSLNETAELAGVKTFIKCDSLEINATSASRELTLEVGREYEIRINIILTAVTFINSILTVPSLPLPTFNWKGFTRQRLDAKGWHIPTKVTPSTEHVGAHRTLIAVLCGVGVVAVLPLDVVVLPSGSVSTAQLLQPTSQYVPQQKRPLMDVHHNGAQIVDGEQLSSAQKAKDLYTRPLGYFDLPNYITAGMKDVKTLTRSLSSNTLNPFTYSQRFQMCLYLEEYQMMVDIQQYDMTATLTTSNEFLRLEVMGLAEARPSVLLGDRILLSKTPFDQLVQGRGVINAGYVHRVEENAVLLKFDRGFHASWMRGQQFHVRFTFNRLPLRRCHQVLSTITIPTAQRFFPSVAPTHTLISSTVPFNASPSLSGPDSFLSAYRVDIVSSVFQCNIWLITHVFFPKVTVVGLDTEFHEKSSTVVEMELIQIATDRAVMLFDLREVTNGSDLPSELRKLLQSRDIVKYVVGDRDNIHLTSVYDTPITGQVDVQKKVQNKLKLQLKPGLEKLVHGVLPDIPYVKNKLLQSSRIMWPLSDAMRDYAASDAVLALLVGKKLENMSFEQLRDGWTAAEMKVRPSGVESSPVVHSGVLMVSPISQEEKVAEASVAVRFINTNLNQYQQDAVRGMVDGHHHPHPYVLFGPPGTGPHSHSFHTPLRFINPLMSVLPTVLLFSSFCRKNHDGARGYWATVAARAEGRAEDSHSRHGAVQLRSRSPVRATWYEYGSFIFVSNECG